MVLSQTQSGRASVPSNNTADKFQAELDFWKSAERIDTAEAYTAYLEMFPNGRFSALARAALSKISREQAKPSIDPQPTLKNPAPAVALKPTPSSGLAAYSEDINTGSIDLKAGDRLNGPVTYTVGGIGVKKQLLIPSGEWIVLAATDHELYVPFIGTTGGNRIKNASVALARFVGTRAASLLVFEYNRSAVSIVVNNWPDAVKCERSDATSIFMLKEGNFTLQRCSAVNSVSDNHLRESAAPAMWKDVDVSLRGLGGSLGQFNIESSVFVYNQRSYLRVSRFDCTQASAGGADCESLADLPRRAALKEPNVDKRIAWVKAYLPFAVAGFKRELDEEDSLKTVQAKTMLQE
jgi:hypothetical protein